MTGDEVGRARRTAEDVTSALRLVSFNIHHGTLGSRGRVDPARLGEVCAGFEADVLALQEVDVGTARVDRVDLARAVADASGMVHVFGASRRFRGGHYGNALLVRGSIESSRLHRLSRFPADRVVQERRTALEASVVVGGRRLAVLATHLAVSPVVNGRQLAEVLTAAAALDPPVAVLGDLNRPLELVRAEAVAAGLHCVDHGPTFPARRPRRTIDHVVVTPGVAVVGVEVRSTPISDHAALLVDVDLAPPAWSGPPPTIVRGRR